MQQIWTFNKTLTLNKTLNKIVTHKVESLGFGGQDIESLEHPHVACVDKGARLCLASNMCHPGKCSLLLPHLEMGSDMASDLTGTVFGGVL